MTDSVSIDLKSGVKNSLDKILNLNLSESNLIFDKIDVGGRHGSYYKVSSNELNLSYFIKALAETTNFDKLKFVNSNMFGGLSVKPIGQIDEKYNDSNIDDLSYYIEQFHDIKTLNKINSKTETFNILENLIQNYSALDLNKTKVDSFFNSNNVNLNNSDSMSVSITADSPLKRDLYSFVSDKKYDFSKVINNKILSRIKKIRGGNSRSLFDYDKFKHEIKKSNIKITGTKGSVGDRFFEMIGDTYTELFKDEPLKFIHGDLNAGNILIDQNNSSDVKIGDLETAGLGLVYDDYYTMLKDDRLAINKSDDGKNGIIGDLYDDIHNTIITCKSGFISKLFGNSKTSLDKTLRENISWYNLLPADVDISKFELYSSFRHLRMFATYMDKKKADGSDHFLNKTAISHLNYAISSLMIAKNLDPTLVKNKNTANHISNLTNYLGVMESSVRNQSINNSLDYVDIKKNKSSGFLKKAIVAGSILGSVALGIQYAPNIIDNADVSLKNVFKNSSCSDINHIKNSNTLFCKQIDNSVNSYVMKKGSYDAKLVESMTKSDYVPIQSYKSNSDDVGKYVVVPPVGILANKDVNFVKIDDLNEFSSDSLYIKLQKKGKTCIPGISGSNYSGRNNRGKCRFDHKGIGKKGKHDIKYYVRVKN